VFNGRLGSFTVSEKKPEPFYFPPLRKNCPVCGEVSYSLSGEHPQCSINRRDIALRAKRKQRSDRKRQQLAHK
jgi:hypothetical protein